MASGPSPVISLSYPTEQDLTVKALFLHGFLTGKLQMDKNCPKVEFVHLQTEKSY